MSSTTQASRKHQERDPETGRYVHTWTFVGHDDDGHEFAMCGGCGMFEVYGGGLRRSRRFKSHEAMIAAYPTYKDGDGG